MKITVVSDLHLEFSDCFDIKNTDNADVLILSGDIMIAEDLHDHPYVPSIYEYGAFADLGRRQQKVKIFRDFLKRMSFLFPHVIYVAGNHEFYNGKFYKSLQYLRDECSQYPNVYFMENDCKLIDDVMFIGATLWTDMNRGDPITLHAVRDMMNDFRIIKNDKKEYSSLKPIDVALRHKESLKYFQSVLDENKERKCVIVGHHSPSYQSMHPMYSNDHLMNGAYHSDLSEFIFDNPQIVLWTHGHTHHCFDYKIGNCRIVCNPRGYQTVSSNEETGWDPNIILEI